MAGQLDDAIDVLIDSVNVRTRTIDRERKETARARLTPHDRVRIGDTAKPQYLRSATGEIHEFYEDLVVVCLDTPVGRFTSGHVRCPPEVLELVERT